MLHPREVYGYFKWFFYVIHRMVKSKLSIGKRLIVKPALPYNPDGKILIHLGCGAINSPEFINVDCRPASHIHYVCDARDLSIFPDNYADMIYACHILEHVCQSDVKKVLWEWKRVIRPNGVLRLSVPDFDKIIDVYNACSKDIKSIDGPLMGRYEGYNMHLSVFNYSYLSDVLCDLSFTKVRRWNPKEVQYHNFEDWASRHLERNGKKYPVSLNIEAIK